MKISIYIDKRRKKTDGTFPVKLRFKPLNQPAFILATGIKCFNEPHDYNFPSSEEGARAKSFRLRKILTECEEYVYYNKDLSYSKLKSGLTTLVTGKSTDCNSVETMFHKFSENKYKGTKAIYMRTLKKILEFDKKVSFDDIDKKWLERFEAHLRKDGANTNGVSLHMRNLRAIFNFALDDDITQNYPFRKYKIKHEQTRKRDLSVAQLKTLCNYPCPQFQKKYVELFMLSFYLCGINMGDLFLLKNSDIHNGRIEYYRQKTKKYYSIKIEPEARQIIDKYKGKDFLLEFMDQNSDYHQPLKRMNQQLKRVGMNYAEGIGWGGTPLFPDISSYYARHSWASIAADIDIPIDVIAQALGHANPYATTDIYVNRRLKKIDEANRRVLDYIKEYK